MERRLSSKLPLNNRSTTPLTTSVMRPSPVTTSSQQNFLLQTDLEDVRSERERERLLMVTARNNEFTDRFKYRRVCQWRKTLKFWYREVLVPHCGNTLQVKVLHSKLWFKCCSSTQNFVKMHFRVSQTFSTRTSEPRLWTLKSN